MAYLCSKLAGYKNILLQVSWHIYVPIPIMPVSLSAHPWICLDETILIILRGEDVMAVKMKDQHICNALHIFWHLMILLNTVYGTDSVYVTSRRSAELCWVVNLLVVMSEWASKQGNLDKIYFLMFSNFLENFLEAVLLGGYSSPVF
jgi:hypothetical protein